MAQRVYRSFQALLMLLLGMFLAEKLISGRLSWYINLRFWPLTIVGIIFLGLMAHTIFTEMRKTRGQLVETEHGHHEHAPAWSNLWFLFIPLVLGILIPARPLDASAVAARGYTTSPPLVTSDSTANLFETDSQQRNVLDWLRLFNSRSDISGFLGQPASVIGFVFRDAELEQNQFYVGRFVVSCCAADGFAVAMIVEWPNSASLEADAWVLVKGPVNVARINGQNIPIIQAESVEMVETPSQPYLYP